MKKIVMIGLAHFFIMCSSTTNNFQVRDDFKTVSDTEKKQFLKDENATDESKSVIILTNGFKGEKIVSKQGNKTIYSNYPITNLKTHYADSFSFNNTSSLIIIDSFSKKEINISPKQSSAYKFIYVMKEYKEDKTLYKITLSNSLRPLK